MCASAELAKQFPVILEEPPEDFRHAEYILPVGDRIENIRLQMGTKLSHLFGMARRAGPAASAVECQQIFVMAFRTTDPGKTFVQITAFQIFPDHPGNYRPVKRYGLYQSDRKLI